MLPAKTSFNGTGSKAALILTLSLFAIWGMGQHYYYTMMPQVSGRFHLHGFAQILSDNTATIAYFLFALPAAIYARRLGYKAAVLFGLGCISIGCFTLYPAVALKAYGCYMLATVTLAGGWVFLEVAANPMVANLGTSEGFVRRLNLAQALYPIGSIAALLAGYWLLGTYLFASGAKFVFSFLNPYILLGAAVFLIAYKIEDTPFPPAATDRKSGGELADLRALLTDPLILGAMAAQGLGIVILIANGVSGSPFLFAAFPANSFGIFGEVYMWTTLAFAGGRWVGWALMRYFAPERLLAVFAIGGFLCSLLTLSGWTTVAGFAVLINQIFAAILWPTILGLAIRGKGSKTQLATALICIGSAAGGMVAQQLYMAAPVFSAQAGMVVPAVCFLGIFGFTRLLAGRKSVPALA